MTKSIAFIVYGDDNSSRNALTEDNYKSLADALTESGFRIESILYHDSKAAHLESELERFDAALVWVNPIMEQGMNRRSLDKLLVSISRKGVYVSAHPDIILKIGTKKVIYTTRGMDWGGDIELYSDYDDFEKRFLDSLDRSGIRILKQYRGDGGKGVFKVRLDNVGDDNASHDNASNDNVEQMRIRVVHAVAGNEELRLSKDEFLREFYPYFDNDGMLIDQPWVEGITNGMVRCYLTGTKVSGFGYQESVALCPGSGEPGALVRPMSRRFYFTEDCGLFQDLRQIMETKWIPQLLEVHSVSDELLPLLWDIDLFINDANAARAKDKYTLCEINVSCVSPFPPSSVKHVVSALQARLK